MNQSQGPVMAKRADLAPELSDALVEHLQKEFPDFKITFAGDMDPEAVPEEIFDFVDALNVTLETSMVEGRCADCGKKMPGEWPCVTLPAGWTLYGNEQAEIPYFLICAECEAETDEVKIETV